tara:strand:+ start:119 stop:328 length:210 start_codon:yes stop_codon:yes gene_type:complete
MKVETPITTINEVKSGCRQAQNDISNINKGQTGFVLLFSDNVKQIADMHSIITENEQNTTSRSDIAIQN